MPITHLHATEQQSSPETYVSTSSVGLGETALQHVFQFEIVRPTAEAAQQQRDAEQSYDIVIDPAESADQLSAAEVLRRFENDHVVKRAPLFAEQAKDASRTNTITYIGNQLGSLSTLTSGAPYKKLRRTTTEAAAIQDTQRFFETAVQHDEIIGQELARTAKEMLAATTFIGEKEYAEAAAGIAEYWKGCLRANKDLELLVLIGEIERDYKDDLVKSDDYVLDRVLSCFSASDMQEFKGRIILNTEDVSVDDPRNLKAVLLDDWTISGEQLADARKMFLYQHPDFLSSLEVQLLVANEARIKTGLESDDYDSPYNTPFSTPVRAYYVAHPSKSAGTTNAHITGAHSSVDYEFENICAKICNKTETHYLNKLEDTLYDSLATMPKLTNIVRPYRFDHVALKNRTRVRSRFEAV